MSGATTNQRPEVVLGHLGMHLSAGVLTDTQAQRAWLIGFTRTIWPTIDPDTALRISQWLYDESKATWAT